MSSRRRAPGRPTPSASIVHPSTSNDTPSLPPYRKPSYPLSDRAVTKFALLHNTAELSKIKIQAKEADQLIQTSVELIYERLAEKEEYIASRRSKWDKAGDADRERMGQERDRLEAELQEMKAQVAGLAMGLEESMRRAIDESQATERIQASLLWLKEHVAPEMQNQYLTQQSQREAQSRTQQSRRQAQSEDDSSPGPTLPGQSQERIELTGAAEMFNDRMQYKKQQYLDLEHRTRYGKNNQYIGFKQLLHDAQHGDDGVPLGHADTWFTQRGSPAPGVTAVKDGEEDDDDIVIDRATISTKCPLTLLPMKEPYTSSKCPHSFEKDAILAFIRASAIRVDVNGKQERAVECPVTGCSQHLTVATLHHDRVLVRKIKRMQQAAENEDESEEEEALSDTQMEEETLADEQTEDADAVAPAIKAERLSVAPATQIMDLGSDDDEEMDDENEY